MEDETKIILKTMGLVGLVAAATAIGNIETPIFRGEINKERISLTEKFDMNKFALRKTWGFIQTLTVSNTNNETFVFYGQSNGNLQSVDYTGTNKTTESYGRFSDKTRSFEPIFRDYKAKIDQQLKNQEMLEEKQ